MFALSSLFLYNGISFRVYILVRTLCMFLIKFLFSGSSAKSHQEIVEEKYLFLEMSPAIDI